MSALVDNTLLAQILTVAAAVVIGVGAWFLLWRLVDLLPQKFRRRMARRDETDIQRVGSVVQQQVAIQSGESNASTIEFSFDLGQPSSQSSIPLEAAAYPLLVIAVVTGITAVLLFANNLVFLNSAVSVPGKVVRLEETGCGNDNGVCYSPQIRFTEVASGRQREFVSSFAPNPPIYSVGEEVTVLYSPGKPESATISDFSSLWGVVVFFFFLALTFGAIGAYISLRRTTLTSGHTKNLSKPLS